MEATAAENQARSHRQLGRIASLAAVFFVLMAGLAAGAGVVHAKLDTTLPKSGTVEFGYTFSKPYAESLGLDWHTVYLAALDDLGLRLVRIPVYWKEIEPEQGRFDFADVDWQVNEAAKRGAKIVLSMGMKVPRWPECHLPAWTSDMSQTEMHQHVLTMIRMTIARYKDQQAITDWQIENEPMLPFGNCPAPNADFLAAEVQEAHELDSRNVLIQDAGEFSTWSKTADVADTLGVSLYRLVWDKHIGYVRWPGIPDIYRLRAAFAMRHVDKVIITEMQAEPWFSDSIAKMPLNQQLAQMNPAVLKDNVKFARSIGFPEIYFWGVEWWYWLRTQGHPELWDTGKEIIAGAGGLTR